MINFKLLIYFTTITIIYSEDIVKPQIPNPNSISYHVEFEILSYENLEGRLASGECCSGYKSNHGICRGGSSSCNPYFKVCMSHQQDPQRSTIPVDFSMPVERRSGGLTFGGLSAFRSELKPMIKRPPPPTKPPQTRQSLFKGIFNRIVGSFSRLSPTSSPSSSPSSNSTSLNRLGINKTTLPGATSNAQCTIAYWSTENESNNKKGVIKLRATIPIVNMVRGFQADLKSKQPSSSSSAQSSVSISSSTRSSLTRSSSNSSSIEPNPLSQKVILLVEIWHKTNGGHDKLITRHLELRNTTLQLLPLEDDTIWELGGPNYGSVNTSTSGIKFRYRWRITGSLKYSSSLNDPNDVNNNIITDCPPGFRGDDCTSPVCKTGCHSSHGYCNEPNECKCKFGWTGEFCSLCVPMPGCIHGSCSKPFECRCEEGWSGMFCDKPSCKLGCHPQNGYCEHPGECRCRFGYKGDNCTECATMPGCQNGDCENPLDCNCFKGWTGLFCNIPVCSEGCDLEHGWCRRPNECRCRVGWSGSNCSECVAYPGCKMGNCTQPWTCDCQPGWGAIDCTEKLDYCELNVNPCLNGGTCISVEKNDGSFLCRCNLGFEGKRCEKTK